MEGKKKELRPKVPMLASRALLWKRGWCLVLARNFVLRYESRQVLASCLSSERRLAPGWSGDQGKRAHSCESTIEAFELGIGFEYSPSEAGAGGQTWELEKQGGLMLVRSAQRCRCLQSLNH